MSQQYRRRSLATPILGYSGAALGLAAGLLALPALPFAMTLYMLPLGAALGAGIAVAMPSHNANGDIIKKPFQQKIVDAVVGAFVGAIGATFIPASPLAILGATAGYGAGETLASAATMLRRTKQPPDSNSSADHSVAMPSAHIAPQASSLKSGLSHSFKTGQRAEEPAQESQGPAQPSPKPKV